MHTVKILHCGDLHFDTPFQGFTPMEAEKRKEDLRETFGRIIEIVKTQRIPILLMSGDIFDNEGVTKMTMEYIDKKLKEISNTRVFIAPGNHDYYSSKSFYSLFPWPNYVHIFKEKIEKVFIPELNTYIYGIGFTTNHEKKSLIENFSVDEENSVNIMVLHGDVISTGQSSDYNPITESDIKKSGVDYLALGHKHSYSGINKTGETHWAYCGNPEGRGFDELGTKGVIIGEVGKSWCSLEFVETSKRKYIEAYVDVTDAVTYEDLVSKVRGKIQDRYSKKNLYKVILTGEITEELPIYISVLQDKLKEDFYLIKIQDETTISLDYSALEKEYSLKGIFSRKMRERIETAQKTEEAGTLEKALKIGFSVLEKGKVEIE